MRFLYLLFLCILLSSTVQASVVRTTQLIQAVQSGYMPLIGQLIIGGTDVNVIDTWGRTATHYAVSNNNLPALKLLLNNGADANLADNAGHTPLDVWHKHKNEEMLKLLHTAGAKPLDLWQAAANNDRLSAERLLAVGADAKTENDVGKVPFDIAIEAEHYALAAILLKAAVGINGRDKKGWTPLHWAIFADAWDLARDFIREGSDVSIGRAQNAFDVATLMESEAKLIEVFIAEKGVDATFGWGGKTTLIHASEQGQTELAKLLVERDADINIQTNAGETALLLAIWWGHTELVKLLVTNDADINIQNKAGDTALMKAAKTRRTEIAELLIAQNADINMQNNTGDTVLIIAAWWGQTELVKLLVTNDADINTQNNTESTALMKAAKTGHTKVVELLVAHDANLILKDMYGKTALDYAEERSHSEIADTLRVAQQQQDISSPILDNSD